LKAFWYILVSELALLIHLVLAALLPTAPAQQRTLLASPYAGPMKTMCFGYCFSVWLEYSGGISCGLGFMYCFVGLRVHWQRLAKGF